MRSACRLLDPARDTVLALHARLGLGLASAQVGELDAARAHHESAADLFALADEKCADLSYAAWVLAKLASYGERDVDAALEHLRRARQTLVPLTRPLAATVAIVETAIFLASRDRRAEIPLLLKAEPLPLALLPAKSLCHDLAHLEDSPLSLKDALRSLQQRVAPLSTLLRRLCLLRDIAVEPLPFF
jgi:tetratricopeptide (TPR) repeat protein